MSSSHLMDTYARLPVAFTRGEGVWLWGRDGKMATYAALVGVQALVAIWTGFGSARR